MLRGPKRRDRIKYKHTKSNDTYFSITSIPEDDEENSIRAEPKKLIKHNSSYVKRRGKKKTDKMKNRHYVNVRVDEKEIMLDEFIYKEKPFSSIETQTQRRQVEAFMLDTFVKLTKATSTAKLKRKNNFSGQKKKIVMGDGDRRYHELVKRKQNVNKDNVPINWNVSVPAGPSTQVGCMKAWINSTECNCDETNNAKMVTAKDKGGFKYYETNVGNLNSSREIFPKFIGRIEDPLTVSSITDDYNPFDLPKSDPKLKTDLNKLSEPTGNIDDAALPRKENETFNYQEFKLIPADYESCCLPNFCSEVFQMNDSVVQCKKRTVFTKKISKSPERTPSEIKLGLLLPPNRSPPKLLLVFLQGDTVSDTFSRAADKLGFDVTTCNSYDGALEEFLSKLHDLIIIDARCSIKALDYETLCRSIRNTKGCQHTAAVALVKKSAFDKDDVTVLSLLDAGFNRCIVETTNILHCVNELIQLKHSDMRPLAQSATNQSLYAALDKCNDIVLVTDDTFRLQYANRASERFLGYKYDETLGKTLQEQLIHDPVQLNSMSSSLMRGREWQGLITFRRKGQDAVTFTCKATPIITAGRSPTHFAMVIDIHSVIESTSVFDKPRGSVHSLRRTSFDVRSVGSDYLRRTSLAKLSALPLEAPITKVISLLTQAQEQTSPTVVGILDKVIDLLQNSELYSPHVKDDLRLRCDEPVTSDLITALLMQQPQLHTSASSRRSSNDSTTVRTVHRAVSKIRVPAQIKELLETSLTWDFDIFRLEDLTNKKPLTHLGMNIFLHFDVPQTLNCDEKTLHNWLTVIEMNYHVNNAYHNSTHAADVVQATAGFLEKDRLKAIMDPLDEATSLLAACAHDIDHPGKSSAFLSNCDNPLAILYNDATVLENHHAALTFKLTLGDDRVNIFKNLDRETYRIARHNVIDMILATEMTKHFEHLAKFVNVFCPKTGRLDSECDSITLPENITLVKRMMIKCSDVSNPTRPLRLCIEWARRIAEEYFAQTDEEKSKGLPVVMPMFDRITCSIPKSQIGFVDYIVHDMFEAWDAFIDMPELVSNMRQNYMRWKEFDEQGHSTAADIRKLQNTILMAPIFPNKSSTKRNE